MNHLRHDAPESAYIDRLSQPIRLSQPESWPGQSDGIRQPEAGEIACNREEITLALAQDPELL